MNLFSKGDHDLAISNFSTAIGVSPTNYMAYFFRAESYANKDPYQEALSDFSKAIEINSNYALSHNGKAWLLATCPDAQYRDGLQAIELAKKAVELAPSPYFLDTLAAAYAEAGRFREAIETQQEVISNLREKDAPQEMIVECEKHLAAYRDYRPWRE